MELFIPTLLVLVLSAVVCFFILPKISPYMMGVLALALFIVGAWQHYSMFPYEYRTSLLYMALSDYLPFILIGTLIIGGMVATGLSFGASPPSVASVVPDFISGASAANNKSIFNLGGNTKRNNTSIFNLGSNVKRNNLASTSFKTV